MGSNKTKSRKHTQHQSSIVKKPNYIVIAEQMLGCPVPPPLIEKLNVINQLCEKAGGKLRSRQVIASTLALCMFSLLIDQRDKRAK